MRRALLVWDAAATYWNEWVIGYGPQLQRGLLDALGLDGATGSERWSKLMLLCVGAMLAGSLVLTLQLAWRRRRRTPVDEAARELAVFTRRLARRDIAPRAPSEGPAAYGARAESRLPHAAVEIRRSSRPTFRAAFPKDDADISALAELPHTRRRVPLRSREASRVAKNCSFGQRSSVRASATVVGARYTSSPA